ncbi:uncharacterized protein TRIADDRAFT_55062 [Trichoplax adhaerens]|uniref:CCHC-type domain-containing protein n=1 Tax=Trichoplax adhaerens TaxID=10228 RepID=B3RQP2_TRIAD|nr:hypothetical protein TRIADDRAFT_55062 [Trichoplax adhaerens]EDV26729.1 hypothetical protein TRIADDRAFT_55062 [Trichoplax adhaerens]|eukprot:XP_002110725.1 hypothetical protein TRIADDRAFT_55062 [Trichoplax adhaerens]
MAEERQSTESKALQWNANDETLTAFLDRLQVELDDREIIDNQQCVSCLIRALPPLIRNGLKAMSNDQDVTQQDYQQVVEEIKQQCLPQAQPSKTVWWHRAQLYQRKQRSKESIEQYKNVLLTLAKHCQLHYHQDMMLTMVFIAGLRERSIRRRLLDYQQELNFIKVVDYALEIKAEKSAVETTQDNTRINHDSDHHDDHAEVDDNSKNPRRNRRREKRPQQARNTYHESKKSCYRCGSFAHLAASCTYRRLYCDWCGKKGHIVRECYEKMDYDDDYNYYD